MDVCIKNIEEGNWLAFKSESLKHGANLGEFFGTVVQEHEHACGGSNWEKILSGPKSLKGMLSRKDLIEIRTEFRKGFTLREAP